MTTTSSPLLASPRPVPGDPPLTGRVAEPPPEVGAVADVVSTLGFFPEGSLGLRIRRRRRPFAVLRVDLPTAADLGLSSSSSSSSGSGSDPGSDSDSDSEGARRLAAVLTGLLSRLTGVARVDLLAFAPDALPSALLSTLAERLDASGFSIGLLVHVTDTTATSLRPGLRPSIAVPLSESTLTAPRHHPATGSSRSGGDPHRGLFRPLQPIPPDRQSSALASLGLRAADLADHDDPDPLAALELWNGVLGEGGVLPNEAAAIRLAWPLRRKAVRDLVLMQCAWGLPGAVAALAETLGDDLVALRSVAPESDAPESDAPESDAPDSDVRPSAATGSVFDTFLGVAASAPRPDDLRHSVEVLRRVAECVPPSLAPAPLVMLAWLEWCRGRGTVSSAYLDECLRVDPEYTLALMFRRILEQGLVPEWLT